MAIFYKKVTSRFNTVLDREPDLFNKAMILMLAQAILAFMFKCLVLMVIYTIQGYNFSLLRISTIFLFFIVCMAALLYHTSWRVAAHGFIMCVSLITWSNVMFFNPGVNLVTLQYVLIILSGSYYMLGGRWGMIYSLLNIFPIISYIAIEKYTGGRMAVQAQYVNSNAFLFALLFNFALLLFINYYFFKAFKRSNQQEKELQEHLEKAAIAAEELAAAKTNFLSTMSHELRTPLNAVVGITNILLSESPRKEQMENLNVLRSSAENLMGIINDILDFNKIDGGKELLQQNDFVPAAIVSTIADALKSKAAAKQLDFVCYSDPAISALHVTGDPAKLSQILYNLLGNSIKFTQSGYVLVSVVLNSLNEDTASIGFRIEDTGIGIPSERQGLIFEPFIQASTRNNRQYHGTGLGLTIANRLLRLHGSNLELSSVEGKGSCFTFTINYPLSKEPEGTGARPPVTAKRTLTVVPAELESLRVLIAEDDPVNVMVMKKILKNWGIVPHIALNGEEAVKAVADNDYDVVLMDINMPVMDGFEASRLIRGQADPKKAAVRIIAVTASIGAAIEHLSGYQYLDDCMLKPFKPDELKEKLAGLL